MDEHNKLPHTLDATGLKVLFDKKEIESTIQNLAAQISKDFEDQSLCVIGVLKGPMIFMADLVRKIKGVHLQVDFVVLDAIGRNKESAGTIKIVKDISTNVFDKNILIVEEILDTGRALHFLIERLKISGAKKVKVVSLLDKTHRRALPLEVDYCGHKLGDEFALGYGMDLDQYGRNMESIYALKYPN